VDTVWPSRLLIGATGASAAAQSPLADGEVAKIDQPAGKITIKHGPAILTAVKPGDKIKFAPDRVNGQLVVTKIEKAR
jgi:Cu/Ag efflux protein CusF